MSVTELKVNLCEARKFLKHGCKIAVTGLKNTFTSNFASLGFHIYTYTTNTVNLSNAILVYNTKFKNDPRKKKEKIKKK